MNKTWEPIFIDHEEGVNPCKYGEPAKGFDQKPLMCSSLNSMTCPKGFFCHIGASRAETVCCERSGREFSFWINSYVLNISGMEDWPGEFIWVTKIHR